uniref:Uncharacterized protein n=1 Tax=Arundo donax TaxID=35708 RepID=A0A0A9H374_ARUDO
MLIDANLIGCSRPIKSKCVFFTRSEVNV